MVRLLLLGAPQLVGDLPVQPGRVMQPRPLALLALLASAGRQGVTRDRAVALLWGESGESRARHHLSDALYIVHRDLGVESIDASNRTLLLNERVVPSDLAAFSRASQSRQHLAAVAEYRGPFLDGFHLAGATAFEEWVTAQRQHLSRQYGNALEALAAEAEQTGDMKAAGEWWRRLLEQDPYNSRVAISLARSLLAHGDRGNALEALESHRQLLRKDLDADTGYDVRSLLETVRNGNAHGEVTQTSRLEHGAAKEAPPPRARATAGRLGGLRFPGGRWWPRVVWVTVPAMAGAGLAWFLTTREPSVPVDPDLLAVPPFHAMTTSRAVQQLAADVPDLFWATITGEFGLRVSDPSELERRWHKRGGAVNAPLPLGETVELARASGAGLVVLGSVAGTDTHVRLTASLLTVPDGDIRVAPTTVEGDYAEFPDLVDRLVVMVLAQEGDLPPHRLAALAERDPAAVQAYLSGRRAKRQVVWESDWFQRALELDSGLVPAALERYQLGESDHEMARFVWERRSRLHPRDAAFTVPLLGWRFGATTNHLERITQLQTISGGSAWTEPLNELAMSLFVFARGAGLVDWAALARVANERLLEYDPDALPALFRLFSLAVFEGDTAAARRHARAYAEREPQASSGNSLGWLFSWIIRIRLALFVGDTTEAAGLWAHGHEVVRVAAGRPLRTPSLYASELAPLVGGLLVDARGLPALDSLVRAYQTVDPSPSFPLLNWARIRGRDDEWQRVRTALYDALPPVTAAGLRVRDALFLGEPEGPAESAAAAFLDRVAGGALEPPADSADPTPENIGRARARCWSTLWNVVHGERRDAPATVAALHDTPLPYRHAVCAALIDALAARAEGRNAREAVLRLDSVVRVSPMEHWPYARGVRDLTPGVDNLVVARLLAELGDTARALAAIRRGPRGPVGNERTPHWSLGMLPEYLREEGRLAAAAGDTAGAIGAYRQYLALREGVPRGRAEQADVRRELSALESSRPPGATGRSERP